MEIIEKQVKEVPYGYGYYDGYGRNVIGRANAGLALEYLVVLPYLVIGEMDF